MVLAANQIVPEEIQRLTEEVSYPISVSRLISLARQKKLDRQVIDFYGLFPGNMVFKNKEDIQARTEAVEIIRNQEPAPDEDEIRGAED